MVEIDETCLGGKERNKHTKKKRQIGPGTAGKQPVFGMWERGGTTVAFPVPETDRATLVSAMQRAVEPGTIIYTDDSGTYRASGKRARAYRQALDSDAAAGPVACQQRPRPGDRMTVLVAQVRRRGHG